MPVATKKKPAKRIPTITATGRCEVVVLLDRSGSMSSIKTDMEGGYNRFVEEQRKLPGECAFTLVQFDTQGIDTVYEAKPVADVPGLVLEPRGGTPLLDALGQTLSRTRDRIGTLKGGDKVVFLIITDGQENSSHEFKKDQIKKLVEQQTTAGWAFVYLGANVDAFAEAGSMGISTMSSAGYTPDSGGVKHAFVAMSANLSSYRTSPTANARGMELTDEQRKKMGGKQQPSA